MDAASEPVDKVVWWPGSGELHVALAHHSAGGGEFVVVTLHTLAVDQVGDVEHHLAAFGHPATDLFV